MANKDAVVEGTDVIVTFTPTIKPMVHKLQGMSGTDLGEIFYRQLKHNRKTTNPDQVNISLVKEDRENIGFLKGLVASHIMDASRLLEMVMHTDIVIISFEVQLTAEGKSK